MTFKKIKIVTDSTCDLPQQLVDQWGIVVIPVYVHIGDESFADDGTELDRANYYSRLSSLKAVPTTSAPSPGLCEQVIDQAMADADHVVIITLPPKLSATYEAMRLGVNKHPADRWTLLDSGTTTMAMGYQVLIAAEIAAQTGDVEQVLAAIKQVKSHIKLAALVNSLENLRRSGRVNFAQAGIGTLLQIKPLVTVTDGVVETMSRVRTMSRAREEMAEMARQQAPLERIALLHTNNLEGVEWLRERLKDILPADVLTINITTAVGTHVGSGSLGFVTVKAGWKQ